MATTISVDEETRDRLKKLGAKGESYDDIVKDLIDRYLEKDQEPGENPKGAEGYRKRADRSRKLEEEMKSVSKEADRHLDSQ